MWKRCGGVERRTNQPDAMSERQGWREEKKRLEGVDDKFRERQRQGPSERTASSERVNDKLRESPQQTPRVCARNISPAFQQAFGKLKFSVPGRAFSVPGCRNRKKFRFLETRNRFLEARNRFLEARNRFFRFPKLVPTSLISTASHCCVGKS